MVLKRCLTYVLIFSLLLTWSTVTAAQDSKNVKVRLPSFEIKLNGKGIDNLRAAYPFLVYKDITYFPLTQDYCVALGLVCRWNPQEGLSIQSGNTSFPVEEDRSGNNSMYTTYTAQVASFPITVNGQIVNNQQEQYPLLVFRNITYFPLTWDFTQNQLRLETEWSKQTGFQIRTSQQTVLFQILYDDADSLYVRTGTVGIAKISKALDGTLSYLTEEEEKALMDRVIERYELDNLPEFKLDEQLLEKQDNDLYYGNKKVLSLQPYLDQVATYKLENPTEESGVNYYEQLIPLTEQSKLLVLTVFYLDHIPAPYTPRENHLFLIDEDHLTQVSGYTQQPQRLVNNEDGSYWLYSFTVPKENITTRNYQLRGQLVLITKDGTALLINQQLQAEDIDVLDVQSQSGSLLIRAYNDRLNPNDKGEKDGFYRIDTAGQLSKIADSLHGVAYVDEQQDIYVLTPEKNRITNVTKNKHISWWDYELRDDLTGK